MLNKDLTAVHIMANEIMDYIINAVRGRHHDQHRRNVSVNTIGESVARIIDRHLDSNFSKDDSNDVALYNDELFQLTHELTNFIDARIAAERNEVLQNS